MKINARIPDQIADGATLLNIFLELLNAVGWLIGLDGLFQGDLLKIRTKALDTMDPARINLGVTDILDFAILKFQQVRDDPGDHSITAAQAAHNCLNGCRTCVGTATIQGFIGRKTGRVADRNLGAAAPAIASNNISISQIFRFRINRRFQKFGVAHSSLLGAPITRPCAALIGVTF